MQTISVKNSVFLNTYHLLCSPFPPNPSFHTSDNVFALVGTKVVSLFTYGKHYIWMLMEKQKLLLSHLVKAISFRILERSRLKEYSSLGIEVNTVLESRRTILEDFINNKHSLKTHLVLNSLLSPLCTIPCLILTIILRLKKCYCRLQKKESRQRNSFLRE